MTRQETYDKVKKHLLCQGKKSVINGNCKYRGQDGLKCAIGALIEDRDYDPDWDNRIGGVRASLLPILKDLDTRMLDQLQYLHDNNEPCEWEAGLAKLAERYELNA